MFTTAESLASYVLEESSDIDSALNALCDGEYLETLFQSPEFDSVEDRIEYADSDENKKNMEIVDCAYAIIKDMK